MPVRLLIGALCAAINDAFRNLSYRNYHKR